MARPTNKTELILFAEDELSKLMAIVAKLSETQRDTEFVHDNRTTKDVIAHLYAWQLLELDWYSVGMSGEKPSIPAPGYTFKDAPALNEKLYQDYKDISWDELFKGFMKSHEKLIGLINSHSEEELFTKKKYAWTGSTDMAIYFRSALSSHYLWARNLIRKHFKEYLKTAK